MSSGDEIEAGRVTTAESTTHILAAVPSELDVDFNGTVILTVAPQPGRLTPKIALDGIHGVGKSESGLNALPGGTGVVGRGGTNQGTGIVGLGGGTPEPGNAGGGGIGVHGLGGPQADFVFVNPPPPPGAGVVGQGGRQNDTDNRARLSHAAGVIAIGGGIGRKEDFLPAHSLMETGGVGVYAQGAEQTMTMVRPVDETGSTIPGPNVPSGPLAPGAGVLGRGGVPVPPEGPVAAGVIGLAGGVPIPNISETGNTGVYGAGTTGVSGQGITASGRGGMFKSTHSAQVQLVPQPLPITFMSPVTETSFTRIPAGNESNETLQLPRDGQGGDLLTLMDNQRQCTLWFCVRGALRGADGNITSDAEWAQVLLGPSFKGSR